jgi:hypothetical protein
MLELGKAGTAGAERGALPVLDGGALVATLRTAKVRDAATAVVGGQEWLFTRSGRGLVGRRAGDPEDTDRFRATQTSWWKGSWEIDLEGTQLRMTPASAWRGTHRYSRDGRTVAESGFTGRWLRLPTIAVQEPLPLPAQVFLLWVELVLTRRATAGAAAAGAAAGVAG